MKGRHLISQLSFHKYLRTALTKGWVELFYVKKSKEVNVDGLNWTRIGLL